MSFTDDDLKRLKEEFYEGYLIEHPKFKALLARLEAAEKALEAHYTEDDSVHDPSELYDVWRKAKGE